MALIADDPADRAQQLLALTENLAALIARETTLMRAREALPEGAAAEEKQRLVNLYRLEVARIRNEPALIEGAPAPLRAELKAASLRMEAALGEHEAVLNAVKALTEGLVHAMAEEVARIKAGAGLYGADGAAAPASPVAVALNQTA